MPVGTALRRQRQPREGERDDRDTRDGPGHQQRHQLPGGRVLRPLVQTPPGSPDVVPVLSPMYQLHKPHAEGPARSNHPAQDGAVENLLLLGVKSASLGARGVPSNSCQDSTDTESNTRSKGGPHLPDQPHHPPRALNAVHQGGARAYAGAARPPRAPDALRVISTERGSPQGVQVRTPRVLFLDHVMYTIHMGCHGFPQTLCATCAATKARTGLRVLIPHHAGSTGLHMSLNPDLCSPPEEHPRFCTPPWRAAGLELDRCALSSVWSFICLELVDLLLRTGRSSC